MQIATYRFDRLEFSGSLGDLGTLIPLSVSLILLTGLGVTPVFLMVGLFYIFSGLYFKLPIPVQPLKVVSAIAIAFPDKISLPVIAASGILFGVILLFLAFTGLIDWLAKFFTKPIMRGIQLGLGFILMNKGIGFILRTEFFIQQPGSMFSFGGISLNLVLGIIGTLLTLLLLSSKRFPAALVLVTAGFVIGILFGGLNNMTLRPGPTSVQFYMPSGSDFITAFILLVIPQIPLTLGNAVMGTADTCYTLFGKNDLTNKATYRAFGVSMGLMNMVTGMIAGMPMCHGAGGLAAHYRFGARTGGANIMIGLVFLIIALIFGKIGISFLSAIPNAVLGILLLFAGLELALMIKDVTEKNDLFLSFLIAGIGFATTNMGIAFFLGIIIAYLMKWKNIQL
ncbi:putative sulfate/molybdate transporter [Desulfonema magnum]|uniref:MFS superfamily protein n=1 Tax=Desulfonema magnum TaxID=45655 RepID=A0A975BQ24_9BACT|nr:putative sulfate/molybdate transporter [Desulfonema magnum]QTA89556.1 MFS superfamily protein [Desulfonema magnum]